MRYIGCVLTGDHKVVLLLLRLLLKVGVWRRRCLHLRVTAELVCFMEPQLTTNVCVAALDEGRTLILV